MALDLSEKHRAAESFYSGPHLLCVLAFARLFMKLLLPRPSKICRSRRNELLKESSLCFNRGSAY